jgi:predicted amidohydrolase
MVNRVEVVNFRTTRNYEQNLANMIDVINSSFADFLLFPEVALTGFDYDNWEKANRFANVAIKELEKLKKAFALTIIKDNKNYFCVFNKGLIYKRAKFNLFGREKEFFKIGSKPEIFSFNGLKAASLICFELRFINYWEELKGVDIIFIPARWGRERKEHFISLNKALALSLQTYVVASNSANEFSWGCIFDGWGEGIEVNSIRGVGEVDLTKNKKIRKKLFIGIK